MGCAVCMPIIFLAFLQLYNAGHSFFIYGMRTFCSKVIFDGCVRGVYAEHVRYVNVLINVPCILTKCCVITLVTDFLYIFIT